MHITRVLAFNILSKDQGFVSCLALLANFNIYSSIDRGRHFCLWAHDAIETLISEVVAIETVVEGNEFRLTLYIVHRLLHFDNFRCDEAWWIQSG